MRDTNVNAIAQRFHFGDRTPDHYVRRDELGRLEALADCKKECMTWASTAQIMAGDIKCPNGHSTKGWTS